MAQVLSERLSRLVSQIQIKPQLILEIEGIPLLFGVLPVFERTRFDSGWLFDSGLKFDTPIRSNLSRDYISIDGTTKTLQNQIDTDDGGGGSVQNFKFKLADINDEVSNAISPGTYIEEILGAKCEISIGVQGGSYPEDTIRVMRGFIEGVNSGASYIELNIQHVDGLKRQEIFTKFSTLLDGNIDSSQQNIDLVATTGIILPEGYVTKSLLRIGDELMDIQSITGNTVNVLRGFDGTISVSHDNQDDVETYYQLEGNPLTLALNIMLSGTEKIIIDEEFSTVQINPTLAIPNAIFFRVDIPREYNVTIGDILTIEGASSNNGSYVVESVVEVNNGYYLTLDQDLITDTSSIGEVSFKSKYNTSTEGLALLPREVDIASHEEIRDQNLSSFTNMLFKLKDEDLKGKEFIEKELYRPFNLYAIPRNGVSSVKITRPPLPLETPITLDLQSVTNPQDLKIERTASKYLFNNLTFRYQTDYIEDGFFSGDIFINADSLNRIKTGKKKKLIESNGLIKNSETRAILDSQSRRFFNRYKFGARFIRNVGVLFKFGFNIEVGDIVFLDGEQLKIKDTSTSNKYLEPKFFEVRNRVFDFLSGNFKLELLETNYLVDARYGLFSPSSIVSNYTGNVLTLQESFLKQFENETDKWLPFVGQSIRVRSEDYLEDELFTIERVIDFNKLELSGSGAISTSSIAEPPLYNDASNSFKQKYSFSSPVFKVESIDSTDSVTLDKTQSLFVGQKCYFQDLENYDLVEAELEIIDITANVVTFNVDHGLIDIEVYLQPLSFLDGESIYRYY